MYKIVLALRFLLKRRLSYFCVAATALCVFVVLVVITVLSGLTAEFKRNTYLSVGDCVVNSRSLVGFGYYDQFMRVLEKEQIVKAASPVIRSYVLVRGFSFSQDTPALNRTVEILGIDPVLHDRVTGFGRWVFHHKGNIVDVFRPTYDPNLPGCVPGIGLVFKRDSEGRYKTFGAVPRIRFEITGFPLTTTGALARADLGGVSTKDFYCSDYAQSGIRADWNLIYLPFADAQQLCGMATSLKRANAVHIKFADGVNLKAGCRRIKELWRDFVRTKADAPAANLLEAVRVQDWKSYNRSFVAVAETQEALMVFCFAMLGVITVFIVLVVFYMIVSHKSKDIGILKSIGISNTNVLLLFIFFAFLVGLVGSAIGTVAGWQFLAHINQLEDWLYEHFGFQLWDRQIYAIGDIPNRIDLEVLSVIIVCAVAACLAGALLPSWRASRLEPVQALQVSQL